MKPEEYLKLKQELIGKGYGGELEWCRQVEPCKNSMEFFLQYSWIVISSGMKNQVAQEIHRKIFDCMLRDGNPHKIHEVFGHKGKVRAIKIFWGMKNERFHYYQEAQDKLAYLETLPWVGPITKYHLARNLGLDVCKPDRHLVRIAQKYQKIPAELCHDLSMATGDRIGVVDVVLWRSVGKSKDHLKGASVRNGRGR